MIQHTNAGKTPDRPDFDIQGETCSLHRSTYLDQDGNCPKCDSFENVKEVLETLMEEHPTVDIVELTSEGETYIAKRINGKIVIK